MALFAYTLIVVWTHTAGHRWIRYPHRPWYRRKAEPSFADLLTTLRRVSYDDITRPLLPKQGQLKTWVTQLTGLLSRAG
jgi:hypothetical protein